MKASDSLRDPSVSPPIVVAFDMTLKEGLSLGHEMVRARRATWPRRIGGVLAACMSINSAIGGDWLLAALCAAMTFSMLTRYLPLYWILKLLYGNWKAHFDLETDSRGIRGVHEYEMVGGGRTERKRIDYSWNRLRKLERVAGCLAFEFHGGAETFIPVRAFRSPADLEQCETWARHGLEQGQLGQSLSSGQRV